MCFFLYPLSKGTSGLLFWHRTMSLQPMTFKLPRSPPVKHMACTDYLLRAPLEEWNQPRLAGPEMTFSRSQIVELTRPGKGSKPNL
jgi:hypothetical protein